MVDLASLIGKFGSGNSTLVEQVVSMVSQSGGVSAVVSKLKDSGYTDQVVSWLGDGANLPIAAEAIEKVFGAPLVASAAAKIGLDPKAFSTQLSTLLPEIVQTLSSGGGLASATNAVMGKLTSEDAIGSLKKLF